MKKTIGLLLVFAIILSVQMSVTASDMTRTRLDIVVTDLSGEVVDTAEIGEIVRVTVSMTEFTNLSDIVPSLHFNPNVVQVVRPTVSGFDEIPRTRLYRPWPGNEFANSFFRLGPTMGASGTGGWGGLIMSTQENPRPFVDNRQGLIGMLLVREEYDLIGEQVIYWVYFRVVGPGNADIRLSRWADGNYRPERRDSSVTPRDEHAIYNMVPFQGYDYYVHENAPEFRIPGPSVYIEGSGERVEFLSDISAGDRVFARLHEMEVPPPARLIIAVFDNGRLTAFHVGDNERTNSVEMPAVIGTSEIRVFVWESMASMTYVIPPLVIDR